MKALLYIILALVITGCSYSGSVHTHGLDEAQSMLTSDPARAFEKLNEYDVAEFKDSATMARWALLYGEAMNANRFTAPTDTIINIAIAYYGSHCLDTEYQRACQLKTSLLSGTEPNALASALYVQKEKEFMLYKERARRNQLAGIGIIILLTSSATIMWQRQRLKLKDAQTNALMAEASLLKESLDIRKTECTSLVSQLTASLSNRFGIIDGLCETYYESQGTKAEKKAIVDKVKAQIESLKSDDGAFLEMERCHEPMLQKLREAIPSLKPDEYRLMVYLASGLSNRTIALLIGESIDVAYKRKSRLKAKIAATDTPDRTQFLSVF